MFIKQRRVRSSRFRSRWSRASTRRREYVASLYTTAIVQLFLSFFLVLGAYRSFVMMREKFPDVVWYWKYALPFLMMVAAAFVLRLLVLNVARSIDAYRNPPGSPGQSP